MGKFILVSFIFSVFMFPNSENQIPLGKIIYSIDKDGLYILDLKTLHSRKIYSLNENFLDEISIVKDSLVCIGFQIDKSHKSKVDDNMKLTENYWAINLNSSAFHLYKSINYIHRNFKQLKIKTKFYDSQNKVIKRFNSSTICQKVSHSSTGYKFCEAADIVSESNIVNGIKVISKEGNLYLVEGEKEVLIVKLKSKYSRKTQNGFSNAYLSSDGKNMVYQCTKGGGFLRKFEIHEMDLNTQKTRLITDDNYYLPKYSPKKNYLLLSKNYRAGKDNNNWITDIYLFNKKNQKSVKVATGNKYLWYK